jgi:hypothetical protein
VATFEQTIKGFRISPQLATGLEAILAPEALDSARRYLADIQGWRASFGLGEDSTSTHFSLETERIAREQLDAGGSIQWQRFDVTDQLGVTRSQVGVIGAEPESRPSLSDAAKIDIALEAGLSGKGHVHVGVSVQYAHTCWLRITAENDRIDALREAVTSFLESFVDEELLPPPPTFKVFVGHGGDPQWKYLHRALNETHGILAEAFESAERAGYHTLSVVDQMVRSSAVAVVVMTGELTDADGTVRARENVVHEVGFCQGALGIAQTIVVLEEGVSEPSNIAGLTQVRFPRGRLIDVEARIVEVLKQRQQVHAYQQG